jgi:hypothetical protein
VLELAIVAEVPKTDVKRTGAVSLTLATALVARRHLTLLSEQLPASAKLWPNRISGPGRDSTRSCACARTKQLEIGIASCSTSGLAARAPPKKTGKVRGASCHTARATGHTAAKPTNMVGSKAGMPAPEPTAATRVCALEAEAAAQDCE